MAQAIKSNENKIVDLCLNFMNILLPTSYREKTIIYLPPIPEENEEPKKRDEKRDEKIDDQIDDKRGEKRGEKRSASKKVTFYICDRCDCCDDSDSDCDNDDNINHVDKKKK